MAIVTVQREGHEDNVFETNAFLATGLGKQTEEGVEIQQLLVAEGIGELELTKMLSYIIDTVYNVSEGERAEAIIQMALAKAKFRQAFGYSDKEDVSED